MVRLVGSLGEPAPISIARTFSDPGLGRPCSLRNHSRLSVSGRLQAQRADNCNERRLGFARRALEAE